MSEEVTLINIQNRFLNAVYSDFLDKCSEIERYIEFVDRLDSGRNNTLNQIDNISRQEVSFPLNDDLNKTLRASTYILIYNLLESTMCDSLDAIHETIKDEQIDFLQLSDSFKKIVFSNFRKIFSEKQIDEILRNEIDIRVDILSHGYDKRDLFSGNLDCDTINKYSKKYQFLIHPSGDSTRVYKPEHIKEIRRKRNALAHGSLSFFECGRDTVVFSLKSKFVDAKNLLLSVFQGIDKSLSQKKYLR